MIAEARRRITRDTLRTQPIADVEAIVAVAFAELEAELPDEAPAGVEIRDVERWIEDDLLSGDVVLLVRGRW